MDATESLAALLRALAAKLRSIFGPPRRAGPFLKKQGRCTSLEGKRLMCVRAILFLWFGGWVMVVGDITKREKRQRFGINMKTRTDISRAEYNDTPYYSDFLG